MTVILIIYIKICINTGYNLKQSMLYNKYNENVKVVRINKMTIIVLINNK